MSDAAHAARELDETQFQVLNAIVLKKMASVGGIADACELSVDEVASAVQALAARGLVAAAGDDYLPMNDAEPTAAAWADANYSQLRGDDVEKFYQRFERINRQFLEAMTSWQQVPVGPKKVPNDHTDAEYDARVLSTIEGLVSRLARILDTLTEHVPRLTTYSHRFDAAIERVDDGQTEYVAKPTVDSVHNVWFEFHEDLLRILGKEREE